MNTRLHKPMTFVRYILFLLFFLLNYTVGAQSTSNVTSTMSSEELLQQARIYYLRNDCELAQYLYQEVLNREATNGTAQLGLGRTLVCQGALAEASTIYNQLLSHEPNNIEAQLELSTTYLQRYRNDPSITNAEQASVSISRAERIAPQDARVHNVKGIYLYETAQFEQALSAFETALSLGTQLDRVEKAHIYVNIGLVQYALGQDALATTSFRRGVSLNPTNAEAHSWLGQMYFRAGRCDDALFELEQSYFLSPRALNIVANLAISTFECGNQEAAIPYLEEALDLDGLSAPGLYIYLARAYLSQGRFEPALTAAQKSALLPPVSAEALFVLGQVYQRMGENDAAREAYNRALELDANYSEAQQALSALPSN